ncbi:hypothetical protein AOLI_G00296150 [Acnodon oligacanthus]
MRIYRDIYPCCQKPPHLFEVPGVPVYSQQFLAFREVLKIRSGSSSPAHEPSDVKDDDGHSSAASKPLPRPRPTPITHGRSSAKSTVCNVQYIKQAKKPSHPTKNKQAQK